MVGTPRVRWDSPSSPQADTPAELRTGTQDAVRCHFHKDQSPKIIRRHFVRDELIVT